MGRGEGMEERKGLKSRTPDFYYHVTTRNLSLKVNDPNNDFPANKGRPGDVRGRPCLVPYRLYRDVILRTSLGRCLDVI